MPTDASLDLTELGRLEQGAAEEAQRGDDIHARRQLDGACRSQLRPLLDLVDRMGEALKVMATQNAISEEDFNSAFAVLIAYQRAKGEEKPCEEQSCTCEGVPPPQPCGPYCNYPYTDCCGTTAARCRGGKSEKWVGHGPRPTR